MLEVLSLTTGFISTFCFICLSAKSFAIFQQCSYRPNEFFSSYFNAQKREIIRLSTYSLVFLFVSLILCACFKETKREFFYLSYLIFIILSGLYYLTVNVIKRPKITKRFLRIYICSCLVVFILFYTLAYYLLNKKIAVLLFCVIPILNGVFIIFSWVINLPYDCLKYGYYVSKCKRKLNSNESLIKIGITGSYGKTTTKYFLSEMLKTTFSVLSTPESYNTPMGICKTVNGCKYSYEILIAEMGARRKNDIKKLCKIVKPNIGIMTGIAPQHTKTLKGLEGIKSAKKQLIEALPSNGYAVFSSDCSHLNDIYNYSLVERDRAGINGGKVFAREIVQTKEGIYFKLCIGDSEFRTFTPLLGEHNISNVCTATTVAVYLGVSIDKILSVIPRLSSPPHRAQLINLHNGITVIDDGYNANLKGVKSTAKSIMLFSGKKFAITCGIVELGEDSQVVNEEVGKVLAEYFDEILVIGSNSKAIIKGSNGKAREVEDLNEGKKVIKNEAKKGDVVAFFNDLPDRY